MLFSGARRPQMEPFVPQHPIQARDRLNRRATRGTVPIRAGDQPGKHRHFRVIVQVGFSVGRASTLRGTASVVSRNWLVFRRQGFSPPARRERRAYPPAVCEERATTREAKRAAARRVAPKMAWGFVAPRSQIAADMLPRRASPQAILGATKHQRIARHHTSWCPRC